MSESCTTLVELEGQKLMCEHSVVNKMEQGDGMSFSEFTYPLLQGWDWWHMYRDMGVQIQIGGSDQYGNIVAGIDAVKHISSQAEHLGPHSQAWWRSADGKMREECMPMGITVPLLTTSSGEKFGKSAGNAVWLDRSMTSPFDLYGVRLIHHSSGINVVVILLTSYIVSVTVLRHGCRALSQAIHLLAHRHHRRDDGWAF